MTTGTHPTLRIAVISYLSHIYGAVSVLLGGASPTELDPSATETIAALLTLLCSLVPI